MSGCLACVPCALWAGADTVGAKWLVLLTPPTHKVPIVYSWRAVFTQAQKTVRWPGGSLGTPGPEHRRPADPVGQAAPVGGPDGHCRMAGAAGLWRRRGGHSQAPDLAHQPE